MVRTQLVLLLALTFAAPVHAEPLTKQQLLDLISKGVDQTLVRSLVERDCVAFDIDSATLVELSPTVPPSACRQLWTAVSVEQLARGRRTEWKWENRCDSNTAVHTERSQDRSCNTFRSRWFSGQWPNFKVCGGTPAA